AIELSASTNFGHLLYSVSLDGVESIYNASTFWLVTATTIFLQSGLDPKKMHTINATNISGGSKLTLSSITVYQVEPSPSGTGLGDVAPSTSMAASSHKQVNIGAIIGPVLSLVVLFIGVFFGLRYRKARLKRASILPITSPSPYPNWGHTMSGTLPVMTDLTSSTMVVLPGPAPGPACPEFRKPTLHLASRTATTGGSPTTAHHSPSAAPSPATTPDVNQLLELIVQRIDRREQDPYSTGSPPVYPGRSA
ncbi:hypothetical protein C8J57DRAFT_362104, partial [Mycena rebaudengoi]